MSDAAFDELAAFGDFLERALRELGPRSGEVGPEGTFSMVEHLWHLADLEREGFTVRIQRMRDEENPELTDFDGDRIARERAYRTRDAGEGLRAFRDAREHNLSVFRALTSEDWCRTGCLEGFGPVALRNLPKLMQAHDASHRIEIDALLGFLATPPDS